MFYEADIRECSNLYALPSTVTVCGSWPDFINSHYKPF